MVRIFSSSDVAALLDLEDTLTVVATAFEQQYRGAVERPDRPHYPIGTGLDADAPAEPTGTGLCMPAYIHGSPYAATKLATVCPDNADRGRPTVNAQISLVDAETGQPAASLEATRITNVRTGCIGGLAARELDGETIARADRIVADVPAEAAETGDLSEHADREIVEFGAVLTGECGRESDDERIVFSSVGSAVLDAATAEYVYERGVDEGVGTVVSL